MGEIKEVTSDTFQREVLDSDERVLVDFGATWCAPCQRMKKIIDAMADEIPAGAKVVKADLDKLRNEATRYAVTGVPCLLVFEKGELIERKFGLLPKSEILQMLTRDE